ncbi:MAG TPA: pyruvate ferredoxin oxidoreductase [Ruminococcus sp.]|nr:pyruvate ferredoxin oxidoreductase [Ruminococcus sp.]HBN10642.1 pyruvate ferredoxin oxidoreductase [Ruminococcus sp.]HCR73634.1 pyruvate ferredoxin oxidoreductase [Ruminococcus sp.]
MNRNCLLCGVGGQGTVLASKLIAMAAMDKGLEARTAETIGMAQRGGCVVSHVRTGNQIFSPMIPLGQADVIIGFEPAEAVRCLPYLKKDGVVIVNSKPVKPVTASLGNSSYNGSEMIDFLKKNTENLIVVNGDEICEKCGTAKVINVAMLGCAVNSGNLGITLEDVEKAIVSRLPQKFHELNLKALRCVI